MIKVNNKEVKIFGTDEDLISELIFILISLKSLKVINSEKLKSIINVSENEVVKEIYRKIYKQ